MRQRVRGMRLTLAFSLRPSSSLGIGPVDELGAQEQAVDCDLQGSRTLTKAPTSLGLDLEAAVKLSCLSVSMTSKQWQSVWVTVCGSWSPPTFQQLEEPEN